MIDGSELEDEIARLRDLDLPTLRARWRTMFRRKAPEPLPRHLLFRILAYRLQAERFGDLDKVAGRPSAMGLHRGDTAHQKLAAPALPYRGLGVLRS